MIIGVPSETYPGERRVAQVPAVVPILARDGVDLLIEREAGARAGFTDAAYEGQGAQIAQDRSHLFSTADAIVQVRAIGANPVSGQADLDLLRTGQVLIGLLDPLGAPEAAHQLAEKGVTAFALELVPRISRAQPMDALTAMATISGYKAVLLAADALPKMFPMMMTAAGTISPARTLVVGAGVAGLQAIATSRRLGAVVQAYDVRPAVKEQVESLGARFVELELATEGSEASTGYAQAMDDDFYRRQRELMAAVVADSDVVITTAAVPGSKAPVLVTKEMVREMRPGSVIVDLAAETGGNCELTRPGETVEDHGVTIIGPVNLPSTVPYDSSSMYARTVASFLHNLISDGEFRIDLEDEVIRGTLLTYQGEVVNSRVRELLGIQGAAPATTDGSGA